MVGAEEEEEAAEEAVVVEVDSVVAAEEDLVVVVVEEEAVDSLVEEVEAVSVVAEVGVDEEEEALAVVAAAVASAEVVAVVEASLIQPKIASPIQSPAFHSSLPHHRKTTSKCTPLVFVCTVFLPSVPITSFCSAYRQLYFTFNFFCYIKFIDSKLYPRNLNPQSVLSRGGNSRHLNQLRCACLTQVGICGSLTWLAFTFTRIAPR